MTDGIGFLNGSALSIIRQTFQLRCRPAVVQGRIAGSKGLWMLHPLDRSPTEPPRIWIRDSQKKVNFPNLNDRTHRIFNYLGPARVTSPHRLSMQSILNLSHNGVPHEVFTQILRQGLDQEVARIVEWDQPHAMRHLWKALYQLRVGSLRLYRQARGVSRALGLTGRKIEGDTSEDAEVDAENVVDAWTGRNQFSGTPISLHEITMEMLQAGFHPLTSRFLYDKIRHVLSGIIDSYVKDFKLSVPQSVEAFICPGHRLVLVFRTISFTPTFRSLRCTRRRRSLFSSFRTPGGCRNWRVL
jgi:RNA-dependent RNA polymerase